jgi:NAD(P)-dependent dehydrogenase (short-subunit alcohol dehydrogenase family)
MSQFAATSNLPTQYDVYPFISSSRMEGKLKGKTVIITGASAGIGRASAHAFAAAGANVACVARRAAELDALVSDLQTEYSTQALAVVADVSEPVLARSIITKVEENLGPVDVLLNCAGITRFGTLVAEEDFSSWWRVLEENLRGPVALIHAVLPSMTSRQTGVVMTVSSTSGSQDIPYNTAYATSKAAIIKFHQDLAVELRRHGVLSFSVHPGTVSTDLSQVDGALNTKSIEEEPDMQQAMQAFKDLMYQTPELAANTFVTLAAEARCKALNGRYIDSEQNLESVLLEAEKEGGGRVKGERLYHLKVDEL